MSTTDDNWDRRLARLVVSPGAILSLQKAAAVREAIRKIETSDEHPELKRID